MKRIPLLVVLTLATVFVVGCGDEISGQQKEEMICGKMIRMGATSCSPNGSTASGTATATTTSTVTITQTN